LARDLTIALTVILAGGAGGRLGPRLSHYTIVEKIGAGGMGVVYRAHDEQLDRDVAIKVLPRGSFTDESARKRFRKEALALARLNHPNIATVHEFGTQDDTDFLVTEYIAGITLDVKLARGPLPPPEVVRLGGQLAAGLAAAHQQGIIHRDLKPGNLRLTTDGRLKILDFGLAQLIPHPSDQGQTVTLTKSQETSGTLPYMSPEQLSGEGANARTDIWAAGTVLYEMSTGKRPFAQTVPALLINAILNQAPAPPSQLNPDVPDALDAVILKALAHQPALRYQTAGELAVDLERPVSATTAAAALPRVRSSIGTRSGPTRVQLITLAAIFLLAIGGTVFFLTRHRQQANTAPPVNRRRSVAVLGFRNLSANPDKSWLSTALAEMLTTELSQGDQLRTIPGESVAQMKVSLSLSDADSFSQPTLKKIRQNLGSDAVVLGSYLTEGNGQLRLDVRLQDAVAGETLASISERGSEADIDSLVSKAGSELRGKLGVGALSDAESASVRASLPSNPEAERLYSEGLDKLRLFDALAARDALQKAAALDPTHAPTHSALAEAWSILGYDAKAKEQAKLALDLSGRSSREEKLLIEGRSHAILDELPQAIESYRALWEFFPDNVDYGLSLIRAQIAGGHANDAEATLAVLRKLNASEVDEARIDLAEGGIAASLSDFKRQQAVADRAATRGQAVGASLLAAEALQVEVEALERMGESQKVMEVSTRARDLFAAAGDRRGAARNLLIVGDLLYDEGDYEGARKKFEESIPTFREIGAEKSVRAAMERIGNVFYQEGKLQESVKYYAQVLKFDHELNDPVGLASDYGNMANALDGMGDLTGALKMQQDSLASFNQIGDRRGSSTTLNNLGNLALEMGQLKEALGYLEQSAAMTKEIDYRRGEAYPIGGLGDAHFASGDVEGAKARYKEALALCKEVNDEDFTAQLTGSLSAIALAEEKYAEGDALAREAEAGFAKSNSAGMEAAAMALDARNLLGAGNLKGAQAAVDKANTLLRQSTLQAPRFEMALADARVKARSGRIAEARQDLDAALASAHKFGYRFYELQLRLARGEIELWSKSPSARTQLAAVENDARAQGMLLVANQAQALQQGK
jgi:serine/threonine protein kinase/tetratricopeptide (TPR) repeat protein